MCIARSPRPAYGIYFVYVYAMFSSSGITTVRHHIEGRQMPIPCATTRE